MLKYALLEVLIYSYNLYYNEFMIGIYNLTSLGIKITLKLITIIINIMYTKNKLT